MKKSIVTIAVSAALTAASVASASDANKKKVWGGGNPETSSYSGKYVPAVIKGLEDNRLSGYQWAGVSEGTVMNEEKVTQNPTHLAVGQLDIIKSNQDQYALTVLKSNIGPECLYAVTKEKGYENWGHLLGNAWDLKILTGGKKSGSYGTWKNVSAKFNELSDTPVQHVGGTMDILKAAKSSSDPTVAFFVMRPDPSSKVFEYIDKNKMNYIPVVDFSLEEGYEFFNLKVARSGMFGLGKGKHVETACTSVALFTGDPSKVEGRDRKRLEATIKRVKAASDDAFTPTSDDFRDAIAAMTAMGTERMAEIAKSAKATAEVMMREAASR